MNDEQFLKAIDFYLLVSGETREDFISDLNDMVTSAAQERLKNIIEVEQ